MGMTGNSRAASSRRFWQGMRTKVTIQMLFATLVPIIILIAITWVSMSNIITVLGTEFDHARQKTEISVGESLKIRAIRAASSLDNLISERLREVRNWGAIPTIFTSATRATQLAEQLQLPSMEIDLIESEMRENRKILGNPVVTKFLTSLTVDSPFAEIFFTDSHGYNVDYSNMTSDFVQSDEEWWQIAWNEGTHISEVEYDDSAEIYALAISSRIDEPETGEPLGVVKAVLNISMIMNLADQEATMLDDGEVIIFDLNTGYRLADTANAHDPSVIVSESGNLINSNYEPALETLQLPQNGAGYVLYEDRVVGFSRIMINRNANLNWGIIISQPQDVIFGIVNELSDAREQVQNEQDNVTTLLSLVGIGMIVLSLGISLWLAGLTIAPIKELQVTASRLSQGDLSSRAKISSHDELGELAISFNQMAGDLENIINNERKNREYLEETVIQYAQFIDEVALGNLTNRLTINNANHDASKQLEYLSRLGQNLNGMVQNLRTMALQIRQTSGTILSSSNEIQSATQEQNRNINDQNLAINQTAVIVDEVGNIAIQAAQFTETVTQSLKQSLEISDVGQTAVINSLNGMKLIQQRVENIAENILMLSERTQQIGEIIDTVNALADQSKLLALNASIEAARAGEEGKGFAVVAMEVRQLAEQSREATARVRDILGEIQQATNTAVMVTEEGSKETQNGLALVEQAGNTIRELSFTLDEVGKATRLITERVQQQALGMNKLNEAMTRISHAANQSAASTKHTEETTQNLIEMAKQIKQAAAQYEL